MRLDNLKVGTKLVWDTMQHLHGEEPKRIYYSALVVEQAKVSGRHLELGARIATKNSSHWMGKEEKHLRLPTEEELETLSWDYGRG